MFFRWMLAGASTCWGHAGMRELCEPECPGAQSIGNAIQGLVAAAFKIAGVQANWAIPRELLLFRMCMPAILVVQQRCWPPLRQAA